jgi:alkanesulfonate monooxygenase SsuD/methylene tetrahydromethanopterin reductase-like flavin-dependent oxidoreductase (luciferase family)
MTMCIVGIDAAEYEERARGVYDLAPRQAHFDDWLRDRRRSAILGSVEQVVDHLKRLESLGVDGVMLQHLRHDDLDSVRLIGREIAAAVA